MARIIAATVTALVTTAIVFGCTDDDGQQQGSSGTTSSSTSSTSSTADASSGTSTGSSTNSDSSGGCEGVLEGECGVCLAQACCSEVTACAAIDGCLACVGGNVEACGEAGAQDAATALLTCGSPACDDTCMASSNLPDPYCMPATETPSGGSCVELSDLFECNPVTQEPCDVANGSACDVNVSIDGFQCYPADNTHALCEACGVSEGFCEAGLACPGAQTGLGNSGQCSKFCCDDSDCAPDGTCYLDFFAGLGLPVGYCVPA